jgi:hypothetical protein
VTRLVVAAALVFPAIAGGAAAAIDSVTIAARSPVAVGGRPLTLFGTGAPGRAGEVVTIEAKPCGQPSYTGVASATTEAGGHWTTEYWPGINATVRARVANDVSAPISLGQRPWIRVISTAGKRKLHISVTGKAPVWRKRVLLQRRVAGRWRTVKHVVLTEQEGGAGIGAVVTSATFANRMPRGSLLRAVLPRSQARPCYLASTSEPYRA